MVRGITNNAVEFLVQLAIDEDKSRASINKFIKSISDKTIKITYGVNVGESNKNIKTFLEKQNGKVLKVVYDVDRTTSNRNFKTFLDSHKESKGVMVYDVDIKRTQANVNASLAKIKAHTLLTDLDINKSVSRANINKYIANFNPKKILAQVTVDKTNSNKNISSYFDTQKIRNIDVALKLAKGAFNEIREKSKEIQITGIKATLALDINKTKETIKKQIENMKLPKFKVDVIAKVTPNVVQGASKAVNSNNQQQAEQPSNKELIGKNKAKEEAGINLTGYVGTIRDVKKQIKKEFADAGKEATLFEGNVLKAQDAFIKKLEQSGAKLQVVRDAQNKEISKISATVRNSENEVITTIYKPLVATYDNLNSKVKNGSKEVRGFVAQVDKIDSKEVFDMDKAVASLTKKFEQAKHKGYLLDEEIEQINKHLRQLGNNNDVKKLENHIDGLTRKGKQQVETERMINNIIKKREQLLANITRTEKLYSRTHDRVMASELKGVINSKTEETIKGNPIAGIQGMSTKQLRDYGNELSILQTKYSQFHAKATEETKNQMGILSALKVAMEKFPIWMIASTAFYGSMRTLKTFGEVIIDVDKKMTDLKKVMSDDTNFGKVFESATRSAETFGKTISESLDAYVMFAKQGYKGDELEGLSNAAIVAGNVGDIEAGKASEYMIASLLQWDKQSSEAMSVVDSWNEISNNFATTVENLAQGQAKAGATARALGMDFDQLNAVVGTLNARTKQSGNEIGNFVKSTFSNLISAKGRGVLSSLGVGLEDEQGNMRDIMEIYKDVAKEYVKLNQADKNSVTLGLAGKYHISRMQTLLDDLGSANSMYDEMYETSKNSENSAMVENAKYMESLEARINLAKVEVEKLSLAIGEAFLSDGMIAGLQVFSKMLSLITELVKITGALPLALLAGVTALTAFSNRFNGLVKSAPKFKELGSKIKNFATNVETTATSPTPTPTSTKPTRTLVLPTRSVDNDTETTKRNTNAVINNEQKRVKLNRTLSQTNVKYRDMSQTQTRLITTTNNDTKATDRNTESKKKARKAMALFTSGFLMWGAGALAVGVGIELLISKIGKARHEQEELKKQQEQTLVTFQSNEKAVYSLAQRYEELSNKKLDPNTEEYAELLEVQNEIAQILPDLKTGEDAYGNALIANSEFVNERVELLKDQLALQKELNSIKQKQEEEETVNEAKSDYSSSKKKHNNKLQDADKAFHVGADYDNFDYGERYNLAKKIGVLPDGTIKDAKQLLQIINDIDTKVSDKGFIKDKNLSKGDVAVLKTLRKELVTTYESVSKSTLDMKKNLSIVKTSATKNINEIITGTENLSDGAKKGFYDISKSALEMVDNVSDIDGIEDAFSGLTINEDVVNSLEEFNAVSQKVSTDSSEDAKYLSETYGESFKKIREAILKKSGFNEGSNKYEALEKSLMRAESAHYKYQVSVAQVAREQGISLDDARAYVDALASTGEEAENSATKLYELESAIEKVSGVSAQQIEDTDELIFVYETLSERTNLTAKENATLAETISTLSSLYPELAKNGEIRIDSIKIENEAVKALQEAYEYAKDGILTAEEEKTVEQQQETYKRMKNLQLEAQAITKIQKAYNKTKQISDKQFADLVGMGALPSSSKSFVLPTDDIMKQSEIGDYIDSYADTVKSEIDSLMNQLESNSKTIDSINKSASERAKENSKEVDHVAKITDKYALSLEKLKTKLDAISNKKNNFAKHSENYRKALTEENSLIQQQIKLYEQQAKELGAVKSSGTTSTSTSYSSTSSYASGNSNKDIIWNYLKGKGLSDTVVAGIMGNIQMESNFNPTVENSIGAYGIVQWLNSRRTNLQNYAKSVGSTESNLQTQLDFLWKELMGSENKSYQKITQSGLSVSQVADLFDKYYERSERAHIGKRQSYANSIYSAYSGKGAVTTSSSSTVSSGGSSVDAQLEIEGILQTIADLNQTIIDNNFAKKVSQLDAFANKRTIYENGISKLDVEKEAIATTTQAWEDLVKRQYEAQKVVRKTFNDELWQTNEFLKSTSLTEAQREELNARRMELESSLKQATNGVKEFFSQITQGRLDRFDSIRNKNQTELDWEAVKIQSVDPSSERYVKTLERANQFRGKLLDNIKEEQKYINQQLASGQLSVEMYNTLVERAKALKNEVVETTLAYQQVNFDIVQASINPKNESVEKHDFNINRSVAIQELYEEGSADQLRELNYQLAEHKAKLQDISDIETKIKKEMANLDLGHSNLEALEDQLNENELAWYSTQEAIQKTEEAIKNFNETLDETIKDKREDMADKIIDALKDAYEEARDIKISALEEEIRLEEKRHERVMKQYEDELEMFNDIIDAKRREIEDSDRDRTHNNNITELEEEMAVLVARKNAISGINTYDAKKEREELDKQIKDVQKQIDEEYYQYSKELQLQALDDELEERTEYIEKRQEDEDEAYEKNIENLNDQREYWEKFYDDLVNDEREFQRLRDVLTKGTNEEIEAEMSRLSGVIQTHIDTLKASLPDLEDTLNGTMEAVGTNIRDSVIFELEQLLKTMQDVSDEVDEIQKKRLSISNEFGNSLGIRDDDNTHATDKENGLTENDMKVMLAKFAREKIVESLNPTTDKQKIGWITEKTNALAKQARSGENASSISASVDYDTILSTFSQGQKQQLSDYFANNYSELGFSTQEYNEYIKKYAQTYADGESELSSADKQVLLAKYMKEYSKPLATSSGTKNAIDSTATKIAESGRANGSLIKPTISFNEAIKSYSDRQLYDLGMYMKQNSSVISDGAIRSKLDEFAERMYLSHSRSEPIGLDTGGMTTAWGSSGGVDGKGGKYAVLHEREVVLNPIDTQRMFKVSAIMETIMSKIGNMVKLPTLVKPVTNSSSSSTDSSTTIHINIDKMNGTQSDIDNLSNQIANRLLREKGKR